MIDPATRIEWARPRRHWDVVVVGAGPAGAVAARQIAVAGASVLLVDRQRFPRDKVCGGCLSARTVGRLADLGLASALDNLGGKPLRRLQLRGWGRAVSLPLPGGVSVSRRAFDAALVGAAIDAGVEFRAPCHAAVGVAEAGGRSVALRIASAGVVEEDVVASLVIDASGLGESTPVGAVPAGRGGKRRIGCSAIIDGSADGYPPGAIHMAIGDGGYVGVARLEDDRLNVAAAIDPSLMRRIGPAAAAERIIGHAGFGALSGLDSAAWRGTPPLMHEPRRRAAERFFVIGDASGYVEPFTGEGIGWAIHSATLLAPLAIDALADWSPAMARLWTRLHRVELARAQRDCRAFAWALRHPLVARLFLTLVEGMPGLATPFVRRLQGPSLPETTTAWR